MNNNKYKEINRLDFEDILWVGFIVLSLMNIVSNDLQKRYVITGSECYEDKSNNISIIVLTILLLIYIYFFRRNCTMYQSKGIDATKKDLVKVVGSAFFILGTICLLYFQVNSDDNFIE